MGGALQGLADGAGEGDEERPLAGVGRVRLAQVKRSVPMVSSGPIRGTQAYLSGESLRGGLGAGLRGQRLFGALLRVFGLRLGAFGNSLGFGGTPGGDS